MGGAIAISFGNKIFASRRLGTAAVLRNTTRTVRASFWGRHPDPSEALLLSGNARGASQ